MKHSSLTELVLHHFNQHQKYSSKTTQSKGTRRGGQSKMSAKGRAVLIREEASKFLMESEFSNLSLEEKDESVEEGTEEVVSIILQCVDCSMAGEMSSPQAQDSADSILELAACLSSGKELLANAVVNRAVEFSTVVLEQVRAQACKLLGFCAHYLQSEKLDIESSIFSSNDNVWVQGSLNALKKATTARLTDKSQTTRLAAIRACSRFPQINRDGLLWSMAHDPSVANRTAAVGSVSIDSHTIDHIIARVRDVKVRVRVQALETLSKNANIHELSDSQFADLVRSGLSDRCDDTRSAMTKMICTSWMKAAKFDPIALIEMIMPSVNVTECSMVSRAILEVNFEDDDKRGILDDLSKPEIRAFQNGVSSASSFAVSQGDNQLLRPSQVLFARIVCERAKTMSATLKTNIIGQAVPDIPLLCEVLKGHLKLLTHSINRDSNSDVDRDEKQDFEDETAFVCIQLLQLAKLSDNLNEEGSRRHFIAAMKDILGDIEAPEDILEPALQAMMVAHETESHMIQTVSEILSDVSEVGVTTRRDDRVLSILAIVLENTSPKMQTSPIVQGFSELIVPAVTSSSFSTREAGVICLGRYALLSREDAVTSEIMPLLLSVAGNKEEKIDIRGQAILALCDLLVLFRQEMTNADGDSFRCIVSDMLDNDKPAVVAVAAEVAAKLLLAGCFHDAELVAQLLLVFFRDETASLSRDEHFNDVKEVGSFVRLQQLLTVFFPAYSMKSRKARDALLASISPTLTIAHEQSGSKKRNSSWPIARMLDYICSNVDMGYQNDPDKKESKDSGETEKSYVGVRVAKRFKDTVFFGTVTERFAESDNDVNEDRWRVVYDDDDEEDFNGEELQGALKLYEKRKGDDTQSETEVNLPDSNESPPTSCTEAVSPDFLCKSDHSSSLILAVSVSDFLSKECENLTKTDLRMLCKQLGEAKIDADVDDPSKLSQIKRNLSQMKFLITDSTSMNAVDNLVDILEGVESDGEETSEDEASLSDNESIAGVFSSLSLNNSEEIEDSDEERTDEDSSRQDPTLKKDERSSSSRSRRHLGSIENCSLVSSAQSL